MLQANFIVTVIQMKIITVQISALTRRSTCFTYVLSDCYVEMKKTKNIKKSIF